jgi:hypothetical protein
VIYFILDPVAAVEAQAAVANSASVRSLFRNLTNVYLNITFFLRKNVNENNFFRSIRLLTLYLVDSIRTRMTIEQREDGLSCRLRSQANDCDSLMVEWRLVEPQTRVRFPVAVFNRNPVTAKPWVLRNTQNLRFCGIGRVSGCIAQWQCRQQ